MLGLSSVGVHFLPQFCPSACVLLDIFSWNAPSSSFPPASRNARRCGRHCVWVLWKVKTSLLSVGLKCWICTLLEKSWHVKSKTNLQNFCYPLCEEKWWIFWCLVFGTEVCFKLQKLRDGLLTWTYPVQLFWSTPAELLTQQLFVRFGNITNVTIGQILI